VINPFMGPRPELKLNFICINEKVWNELRFQAINARACDHV